MSHLSYQTWNDNKSLASFASEHTIVAGKLEAKKNFKTAQELVNFDEKTIAKIRERSRSKDIRGHRIRSITGVQIPLNEPKPAEISDEESDFDVDMGKIATNIPNLGSHTLHKVSQFAEFNHKQEKKITEMRDKIRTQGLKGRELDKRQQAKKYLDKENLHGTANFVSVKQGLREGLLGFDHLKISSKALDHIDIDEWNDDDFVKPAKKQPANRRTSTRFDTDARY